jgi:hypothetical protein
MESPNKIRVLVFAAFLVLLLVFGMVYKPTDAMSQQAVHSGQTVAHARK